MSGIAREVNSNVDLVHYQTFGLGGLVLKLVTLDHSDLLQNVMLCIVRSEMFLFLHRYFPFKFDIFFIGILYHTQLSMSSF